jgi:hypothetical protein
MLLFLGKSFLLTDVAGLQSEKRQKIGSYGPYDVTPTPKFIVGLKILTKFHSDTIFLSKVTVTELDTRRSVARALATNNSIT